MHTKAKKCDIGAMLRYSIGHLKPEPSPSVQWLLRKKITESRPRAGVCGPLKRFPRTSSQQAVSLRTRDNFSAPLLYEARDFHHSTPEGTPFREATRCFMPHHALRLACDQKKQNLLFFEPVPPSGITFNAEEEEEEEEEGQQQQHLRGARGGVVLRASAPVLAMTYRRIDVHKAAERGDTNALRRYLDAGGDVQKRDEQFRATPLHWACLRGRREAAVALLEAGAPVDARTDTDGTPLTWAAMEGAVEVMEALLDRGADVSSLTRGKATPLHHAASYGHVAAVRLLLSSGADPLAEDAGGLVPGDHFDSAVEEGARARVSSLLAEARSGGSIVGALGATSEQGVGGGGRDPQMLGMTPNSSGVTLSSTYSSPGRRGVEDELGTDQLGEDSLARLVGRVATAERSLLEQRQALKEANEALDAALSARARCQASLSSTEQEHSLSVSSLLEFLKDRGLRRKEVEAENEVLRRRLREMDRALVSLRRLARESGTLGADLVGEILQQQQQQEHLDSYTFCSSEARIESQRALSFGAATGVMGVNGGAGDNDMEGHRTSLSSSRSTGTLQQAASNASPRPLRTSRSDLQNIPYLYQLLAATGK
jgi:hypothetical protein